MSIRPLSAPLDLGPYDTVCVWAKQDRGPFRICSLSYVLLLSRLLHAHSKLVRTCCPNRGKQRAVGLKKRFPGIPCWKIRFRKGDSEGTNGEVDRHTLSPVCVMACPNLMDVDTVCLLLFFSSSSHPCVRPLGDGTSEPNYQG